VKKNQPITAGIHFFPTRKNAFPRKVETCSTKLF